MSEAHEWQMMSSDYGVDGECSYDLIFPVDSDQIGSGYGYHANCAGYENGRGLSLSVRELRESIDVRSESVHARRVNGHGPRVSGYAPHVGGRVHHGSARGHDEHDRTRTCQLG